MAIKKKEKKEAKSGPKGKKARRLAKLDNRWGEAAATDASGEEIKKTTRRGKFGKKKNNSALTGEVNRKLAKRSNEGIDGFYRRLQEGRQKQQEEQLRLQQTSSSRPDSRRVEYDNDDDDDDSSTSSGSEIEFDGEDNDDDDPDMGNENPMGDLLTMIRNKNTNRVEDHDEEQDGEDGSDSDSDDDSSDSDSDDDDDEMSVDDGSATNAGIDNVDDVAASSNNQIDFFRKRFSRPPLSKSELSQLEQQQKPTLKKIAGGKHVELQFTVPPLKDSNTNCDDGDDDNVNNITCDDLLTLDTPEAWQATAKETYSNGTREVLQRHWTTSSSKKKKKSSSSNSNNSNNASIMTDTQAPVYSFLTRYADVFDTTCTTGKGNKSSDRRTQKDQHQLYMLHVLNHVLTSRTRIGRNNRHLKEIEKKEKEEKEAAAAEEKKEEKEDTKEAASKSSAGDYNIDADERDVRDQGFTRPSVLVLLPTRGTCHRFVKDLYRLAGTQMDKEQEDRFDADYGEMIEDDEDDDEKANETAKKAADRERRRKAVLESKGKEWNEFFGDKANQDDDFKIGISLIPKAAKENKNKTCSNVSVKLYSDFFKSDIIVASPLGLKMLLTSDGGEDGDDDDDDDDGGSNGKCDYLSSIEICLLQYSEMILMQNWDHVNDILASLNQEPKSNNSTDFSRVRNYLLEGQGARWCQLIVSSKFWDPALVSTFKRFGKSLSGQVKIRRKIRDGDASIAGVLVPIKQVFQKVPTATFAQQSKARVDYFIKNLLPQLQRNEQTHTLVFVPSYFDFCSLRNTLLKLEHKQYFVSVSEYSRGTEVGRGRARFLQGRKPLMLYTGRAHFFHRHLIKGVRNLVFLGLPEHPEFYADYVNLINTAGSSKDGMMDDGDAESSKDTSCVALFTKYEAHALERVVGSSNASRMLSSANSAFMFYS